MDKVFFDYLRGDARILVVKPEQRLPVLVQADNDTLTPRGADATRHNDWGSHVGPFQSGKSEVTPREITNSTTSVYFGRR